MNIKNKFNQGICFFLNKHSRMRMVSKVCKEYIVFIVVTASFVPKKKVHHDFCFYFKYEKTKIDYHTWIDNYNNTSTIMFISFSFAITNEKFSLLCVMNITFIVRLIFSQWNETMITIHTIIQSTLSVSRRNLKLLQNTDSIFSVIFQYLFILFFILIFFLISLVFIDIEFQISTRSNSTIK